MTHTIAKLQPWSTMRGQVEGLLKTMDPEDVTVMLPYGLQLLHSFCHPHVLRCMAFYHSTKGSTFVTHIDSGAGHVMYTWTVSSLDELKVHCEKFQINSAITYLLSVPQHRVFIGFCTDMTLRVFSDVLHKCSELSRTATPVSALCMAYNEDMDELITGGHGCLQAWKMEHVELRDPLVPGRPINCEVGPDDWVRDIRVFQKQRQLVALCNEGVFMVDYVGNEQLFHMQNWHASALTSFVWYRPLEYFITASMDGAIKVWNAIVFSQVHEFIGHYNCVTGLVTHPTDPLLISSSKDGTLRVWRLDTFQLTQRIDVTEEILGMTIAHGNQIYYYTLHDVRVWNFNQFHHLFTPIQSCIHKLARIKSLRIPSRILCAAEDGSVRLISSVSGSVLTIVYPMATYQVHTDIVYDPLGRRIYTALNSGDILIFDASTNPCYAKELWIPPMPEESILCLALVKLDCALGRPETMRCESLIFAGNNGGQISLLDARTSFMKDSIQGHGGAILALECSHGTLGSETEGVGTADRLISSGSDKKIQIWKVFCVPESQNEIDLISLCSITCTESPSHVSMMANSLCMALPTNNAILVYEIIKPGIERAYGGSGQQEIKKYRHLKDHDHTQNISALCCCPRLGLFASSSGDGSVKVWDKANTLVRELCFDSTLRGVCFANDHGDILIGFQNHVSYVSVTSYLPYTFLEKLPAMTFSEETMEEPLPFNPDHQLWFDIDNLPVFPANLQSRRRYVQKLSSYMKAYSSLWISSLPDETSTTTLPASTEESLLDLGSDLVEHTPSPLVESAGEDLSKITEQALVRKVSGHVTGIQESQESPEASQPGSPTQSIRSSDSTMTAESSTSEDAFVWPIAPDGFIPNSALRALMFHHYRPPTPPPAPWVLKMVPLPEETSREKIEVEPAYDTHEPFTWASSSEESIKVESPTDIDGALHETAILRPVAPPRPTSEAGRQSVEDHKMKLRTFSAAVPKLITIPTFEPAQAIDKSGMGKKARRKGRGINVTGGSVRRRSRRQSQFTSGVQEEGEEYSESESDESDGDGLGLLQRLAQEKWFPQNVELDVDSFINALLLLLETTRDAQYRTVCNAIIDIHKEYGFTDSLKQKTLDFFDERLTSPRGVVRANAVRVMTELGANRADVIMKLIPKLVDEEEKVRHEAVTAVDVLAGIRTKDDLAGYLAQIGLFKPYRNQDAAVLADLSQRYTSPPSRPRLQASLQSQMRVHRHYQAVLRNQQAEREGQGIYQELSSQGLSTWDHGLLPGVGPAIRGPPPRARGRKITKKQRKKVDRPVWRKPTAQQLEDEDLQDEESSSEEEGMQETESDFYYQSDEYEEESKVVQFDAVSFQRSEEIHAPRLTQRRPTLHDTMLEARAAMLAQEKDAMVVRMQAKLRRHREQYEKLMQGMSERALQRKKILPVNPFYWRYYGPKQSKDRCRSESSASSLDTKPCSSMTSISRRYSTVREEVDAATPASSPALHAVIDANMSVTSVPTYETSQENVEVDMHMTSSKSFKTGDTVLEPILPLTSVPSYKTGDANIPLTSMPSFKTGDSSYFADDQVESGFAESTILTSTLKASDTADGRTLETYGSSGVYTDSFVGSIQIKGLRSKVKPSKPEVKTKIAESPHSLTVANVKRHEHLSAKKGKRASIRDKAATQNKLAKAQTAIEEWREFLREQGKRKKPPDKILPQKDTPVILPRIPAGIPLANQGGNQRLLYCISTGPYKTSVKDPSHMGYFGSSDFGHMNMVWTNLSPAYHLKKNAGTPTRPAASPSSLELSPTPGGAAGVTHSQLRGQSLYPSLGKVEAIKGFDARTTASKDPGPIYKWKRPEPVVLPSIQSNLEQVVPTARWTKDTDGLETKMDKCARRRPLLDPACTPIVPRNSTISSTFLPQLSPKLKSLC